MKPTSVRLSAQLLAQLSEAAQLNGRSITGEIEFRLAETFVVEKAIVWAWFKADRWGDIDERNDTDDAYATCDCGQDIDIGNAWFVLMSSGKMVGPFCGGCATSE